MSSTVEDANLCPTAILDYRSGTLQRAVRGLPTNGSPLDFLRAGHRLLCDEVTAVYTVDELQPASQTFEKRRGACSQRFACLEALARAHGIPTRVKGLWIAGEFWAPRFRFTRPFIPRRILLAWPQFHIEDGWMSVETLFGSLESLALNNPNAFANDGESLFDAVGHAAVDFEGCTKGRCNLSRFTVADAGVYASRDELFAAFPLFQKTWRGKAFEMIYGGRKSC